jgi:hypothetical protein
MLRCAIIERTVNGLITRKSSSWWSDWEDDGTIEMITVQLPLCPAFPSFVTILVNSFISITHQPISFPLPNPLLSHPTIYFASSLHMSDVYRIICDNLGRLFHFHPSPTNPISTPKSSPLSSDHLFCQFTSHVLFLCDLSWQSWPTLSFLSITNWSHFDCEIHSHFPSSSFRSLRAYFFL